MTAADTNYDILPGDWWLIRQCNLNTQSVLRPRRRRGVATVKSRQLTMAELSETAAKLCFRLHSMYLQGVPGLLKELQQDSLPAAQYMARIREINRRLDLGGKRIEKLKQGRDVQRFTVDQIYKLAVLQGVPEPAPCVLEWGAVLTWLLLHLGSHPVDAGGTVGIPGGTVPLECVVYAACAMFLIEPIGPKKDSGAAQDGDAGLASATWQRQALEACEQYLSRPRLLLGQADFVSLSAFLEDDPAEVFRTAQRCSERLCPLLIRLGVRR